MLLLIKADKLPQLRPNRKTLTSFALVILPALALALAVIGMRRLMATTFRRFQKERIEVDFAYRLNDTLAWLLIGLALLFIGIVLLYVTRSFGSHRLYLALPLPVAVFGVPLPLNKDRLVLTAQGRAAKDATESAELPGHLVVVTCGGAQTQEGKGRILPV